MKKTLINGKFTPGPKPLTPRHWINYLAWEAAAQRDERGHSQGSFAVQRNRYRRYSRFLFALWSLGGITLDQLAALKIADVARLYRKRVALMEGAKGRRTRLPALKLRTGVETASAEKARKTPQARKYSAPGRDVAAAVRKSILSRYGRQCGPVGG